MAACEMVTNIVRIQLLVNEIFVRAFAKAYGVCVSFFLWKMYAGFWSDFFLEELLRFITIFSCSDDDTFLKIL